MFVTALKLVALMFVKALKLVVLMLKLDSLMGGSSVS